MSANLARGGKPFEGVGLVCIQHLLDTTGSLFESLLTCGLEPRHVFVLGKLYSNCSDVQRKLRSIGIGVMDSRPPLYWGKYHEHLQEEAAELWRQVGPLVKAGSLKQLLVLDDGGHAVISLPTSLLNHVDMIGVEQTMSGTFGEHVERRSIPVIDVASSAAKKLIEAPLIASAVIKKLETTVSDMREPNVYGVVGFGNVGRAICDSLVRQGKTTYVFEVQSEHIRQPYPGVTVCKTLEELFTRCNYIFGCTGRDVLKGTSWWQKTCSDKVLVSCSSSDIEFSTVIDTLNEVSRPSENTALSNLKVPLQMGTFTILRGGYPINFDGTHESVPANQIQMTRGLLIGALFQAVVSPSQGGVRSKMLSPQIQQLVVRTWMDQNPEFRLFYSTSTQAVFEDAAEIAKYSGGVADSIWG